MKNYQLKLSRSLLLVLILMLFYPCVRVLAAPSGADLLNACQHALAAGFKGIRGQMCAWYVTPCDCTFGKEPTLPRVCLPVDAREEDLAKKVVEGLTDQPQLQTQVAAMAVAIILSKIYPCTE